MIHPNPQTLTDQWLQEVHDWTPPEAYWHDRVAQKVQWCPCRMSSETEKYTRRICVEHGQDRIIFKQTRQNLLIQGCAVPAFLAMLTALVVFIPTSLFWRENQPVFNVVNIIVTVVVIGLLLPFAMMLVAILWKLPSMLQNLIFDRGTGYSLSKINQYSKAIALVGEVQSDAPVINIRRGPLSNIYALQLLSETMQIGPENIHTLELNCIFYTGDRVNILDHESAKYIRAMAAKLATVLDVPVWDDSQRGRWEYVMAFERPIGTNTRIAKLDKHTHNFAMGKAIWMFVKMAFQSRNRKKWRNFGSYYWKPASGNF